MTDLDQPIAEHRREHDHLDGRQKNPWVIISGKTQRL